MSMTVSFEGPIGVCISIIVGVTAMAITLAGAIVLYFLLWEWFWNWYIRFKSSREQRRLFFEWLNKHYERGNGKDIFVN